MYLSSLKLKQSEILKESEDFNTMAGGGKEMPSTDVMKDSPGVEINPKVWADLPNELVLLTLILMRLPWWSNLQLRRVCKEWNSMLRNHTLLSKFSPTQPPTGSFCCILKNRLQYKIVHASVRKWHTLPRSQILPKLISSDRHVNVDVTAATSGLLLVSSYIPWRSRFLVNPFNGTQRQLPPLPTVEDDAKGFRPNFTLGMTADHHNVKVVLVQHLLSRHMWRIYVYDLLRDSWDVMSDNLHFEKPKKIANAVLVGNNLFLLISSTRCAEHRIFIVRATSLIEIPVEQTSLDVPIVHLFQHRGSLMIVKGTNANLPVLEIWRLDQLNKTWDKVASMPDNLLDLYYSFSQIGPLFTFDTEGDYICLSNYGLHLKRIIVYNIVEQMWEHISYEDTEEDGLRQCAISPNVYIWQPRLDIVL